MCNYTPSHYVTGKRDDDDDDDDGGGGGGDDDDDDGDNDGLGNPVECIKI